MKAKVAKVIKKEPSMMSKSIQPFLIVVTLCVVAYVGYKVYVAVQEGIRYASAHVAFWRTRLLTTDLRRRI